jgi:glycosyltransferase involved in cell wall biosynthesis
MTPRQRGLTVTVVIPVRDDRPSLLRALTSLARQSDAADAVIVVDDGSNPPLSLDSFPHVEGLRVLRMPEAGGPGPARNMGTEQASTEWIAFLDADDEFLPDRLAALRSFLAQNPESDALYSDVWVETRDGVRRRVRTPAAGARSLELLIERPFITTSSVVVRRRLLMEIGGFPPRLSAPTTEDYSLWVKVARRAAWRRVDGASVVYHQGAPGWQKRGVSPKEWEQELAGAFRDAAGADSVLQRLGRSTAAYIIARRALQEGEYPQAWRECVRSLVANPRRGKVWALALITGAARCSGGLLLRQRRIRRAVFGQEA